MAIDAAEFRKVLGQFASGVTIVTTAHEGVLFGMTASSFASVSLDPPLVLFCADKRARTGAAVGSAGMFAVNILDEHQRDIAELFAAKDTDKRRSDKLSAIGRSATTGAHVLDCALAWLDCRVDRSIDAGDHIIYVGLVVASAVRGEASAPLVYWHGNYRHVEAETTERPRRSD